MTRPVVEVRFDPAPRPQLRDTRVEVRGASAVVIAGGFSFEFERSEGGAWVGGAAETIGRGFRVDEASLLAAREVVAEALRIELSRRAGLAPDAPTDVLRCPLCRRLLPSALVAERGAPASIECDFEHTATYADGAIVFDPSGGSRWEVVALGGGA